MINSSMKPLKWISNTSLFSINFKWSGLIGATHIPVASRFVALSFPRPEGHGVGRHETSVYSKAVRGELSPLISQTHPLKLWVITTLHQFDWAHFYQKCSQIQSQSKYVKSNTIIKFDTHNSLKWQTSYIFVNLDNYRLFSGHPLHFWFPSKGEILE